jgi:hypothetical protein
MGQICDFADEFGFKSALTLIEYKEISKSDEVI